MFVADFQRGCPSPARVSNPDAAARRRAGARRRELIEHRFPAMAARPPSTEGKVLSENRRARMRYAFDEFLEVGIALEGSEVKSVRAGRIELADAYAGVVNGQLLLLNAYIAPYAFATAFKHEPKRARQLLAHREEIDRLDGRVRQKGYTIIPLKVYLKGGRVKLELGLGKGKALEDRREEIKEREGNREARAAMGRVREKG
jgi:SsrA-binding protein